MSVVARQRVMSDVMRLLRAKDYERAKMVVDARCDVVTYAAVSAIVVYGDAATLLLRSC